MGKGNNTAEGECESEGGSESVGRCVEGLVGERRVWTRIGRVDNGGDGEEGYGEDERGEEE